MRTRGGGGGGPVGGAGAVGRLASVLGDWLPEAWLCHFRAFGVISGPATSRAARSGATSLLGVVIHTGRPSTR